MRQRVRASNRRLIKIQTFVPRQLPIRRALNAQGSTLPMTLFSRHLMYTITSRIFYHIAAQLSTALFGKII